MNRLIMPVFTLMLAGCCLFKPTVVHDTVYKYVEIPGSLLIQCDVTKPPFKEDYLSLTYRNKEEALTVFSTSLLKDINLCNNKIKDIKSWSIEQSKIYSGK